LEATWQLPRAPKAPSETLSLRASLESSKQRVGNSEEQAASSQLGQAQLGGQMAAGRLALARVGLRVCVCWWQGKRAASARSFAGALLFT